MSGIPWGYYGYDMTLLYDHIMTCDHMSYDLDMIWIRPEIGMAPPIHGHWMIGKLMIDQWMERGRFTCPIFTQSHIYKNGRSSPYPWIWVSFFVGHAKWLVLVRSQGLWVTWGIYYMDPLLCVKHRNSLELTNLTFAHHLWQWFWGISSGYLTVCCDKWPIEIDNTNKHDDLYTSQKCCFFSVRCAKFPEGTVIISRVSLDFCHHLGPSQGFKALVATRHLRSLLSSSRHRGIVEDHGVGQVDTIELGLQTIPELHTCRVRGQHKERGYSLCCKKTMIKRPNGW